MAPEVAPESAWFKSSYSAENGTNCVEVADLSRAGRVGIRDSKHPEGPALLVSANAFAAFVGMAR
ncbi:DUF397 domain-containing protein [Streptomyces millisiae]|uniref:DUF397 domain-containing protein n=1 Tax=Streptomyces millisiae TaxID=3075542 RepID=A0ABU2LS97_9ACTN|nr:DUF397 domain-containing protein [Streptomyces sp. DSM 44918]MDT0320471.1 DUF397 domain-containing protein [Streptomyces sp. DSM 44918]